MFIACALTYAMLFHIRLGHIKHLLSDTTSSCLCCACERFCSAPLRWHHLQPPYPSSIFCGRRGVLRTPFDSPPQSSLFLSRHPIPSGQAHLFAQTEILSRRPPVKAVAFSFSIQPLLSIALCEFYLGLAFAI